MDGAIAGGTKRRLTYRNRAVVHAWVTFHPYVRKQIKKVLPALCDTFLDKAIDGDLSTMKLLWQMAELDKQSETAGNRANDRKFVRQAIAKFRKR